MNFLATLKSYVESHAATLEAEAAAVLHRFHDFVVGEESKIAAEIEHLTQRGYTVTPPAEPSEPAAPGA